MKMDQNYKEAVLVSLVNDNGYSDSGAQKMMDDLYDVSIKVWRYELNAEHLALGMIRTRDIIAKKPTYL